MPITFTDAVAQAARASYCALLAVGDNIDRVWSRATGIPFDKFSATGSLRRLLCSDDPDNDPAYVPPFSGGQCPGVEYDVNFTGTVPGNPPQTATQRLTGPLRYNQDLPPIPPVTGCVGGEVYRRFSVGGTAGTPITWVGCDATFVVNSVVRVDSLPDDCGDPPPPPPGPPGNVTFNTNVTYNIDDSTEITVPTTFVFAPIFFDVDGTLRVPVNIDVGGLTFDGTLEVAPEFNLELFPTEINFGKGATDEPEGFPGEGQPGDEPVDPESTESTIIGVIVRSQVDSNAPITGIAAVNIPDIYAPRLGSVSFAIQTDTTVAWTPDIDVKNVNCYIPCPVPQGAVQVAVSPAIGVTAQFAAVRGQPLTS